jgi:hypothetical protein
MSMGRDWGRRESIQSIPGMDSVLDQYGRLPGPQDRRDMTFGFRVFTNGDNDAAYDLLAAQVAPGVPQRLVYQTDSDPLCLSPWYTVGSNPRIQHSLTAANSWGHGGFVDFQVTWRIRPDWRPRFSETAEIFHAASTFAASTHFGALGTTVIAADPQPFSIDARGTAGSDLPTLPDTGPTITLTGPCGGATGLVIVNDSYTVRDTAGTLHSLTFGLPFSLPTSADSCILKFAGQSFTHNGVAFRPTRPLDANGLSYQREYFRVVAGVLNSCRVFAQGGGALTGGAIKVDFWKKRA